jgi:hypothetical protein
MGTGFIAYRHLCIDPLAGLVHAVFFYFIIISVRVNSVVRGKVLALRSSPLKNEAIITMQLFTAILLRTGKLMSQYWFVYRVSENLRTKNKIVSFYSIPIHSVHPASFPGLVHE